MIAADVMSRSVVAISPEAPLAQAIRLMIDRRVSGLPVIDAEGRAVGMLTEGDLLRRVETGTEGKAPGWFASFFFPGPQAERYVHTHGRRVSEIMTPNVMSVEENTPLADVVALMQRNRIKRLPVVRGERVVGIVSRADLVRVVGEALGAGAVTADDATIRQAILDGLAHEILDAEGIIAYRRGRERRRSARRLLGRYAHVRCNRRAGRECAGCQTGGKSARLRHTAPRYCLNDGPNPPPPIRLNAPVLETHPVIVNRNEETIPKSAQQWVILPAPSRLTITSATERKQISNSVHER